MAACAGDHVVDDAVAHLVDGLADALLVHELLALLEHDLALVVHDVVVLQDVLADIVVARLDLRLRPSIALLIQGWMMASSSLRPSWQHAVQAVGAEDAHQVVLQRQEELRAARIALAAGAAAQLVVDAAAFVTLGAEHVEAAGAKRLVLERRRSRRGSRAPGSRRASPGSMLGELVLDPHLGVAAELDVGAAAGHVGGDGDRARHAGLARR